MIEYLPEIAPALAVLRGATRCWIFTDGGNYVLGWAWERLEAYVRMSGTECTPDFFSDLRIIEQERLKFQTEQIEATKQIKLKP